MGLDNRILEDVGDVIEVNGVLRFRIARWQRYGSGCLGVSPLILICLKSCSNWKKEDSCNQTTAYIVLFLPYACLCVLDYSFDSLCLWHHRVKKLIKVSLALLTGLKGHSLGSLIFFFLNGYLLYLWSSKNTAKKYSGRQREKHAYANSDKKQGTKKHKK